YSAAEAAGELGTSIAAVEMALFRARREVRHALERAGLGPERRRPIGVLAGLLPAPAAATSLGVVGIGATLVITLAGAGGAPAAHTSPPRVRTPRVEAVVAALRPAAPRRVQSRLDESVGVAADHAPAFEPDAQNEPDSAPTAGTTQQEFQPSAAAAAPAPAPAPASASVQAADPVTPLPAVVVPASSAVRIRRLRVEVPAAVPGGDAVHDALEEHGRGVPDVQQGRRRRQRELGGPERRDVPRSGELPGQRQRDRDVDDPDRP